MSQENVEIVRRVFDAFNRRDIAAFLELLDPDVEWVPVLAVLEGSVYRGHGDIRRWLKTSTTDWEFFEVYHESCAISAIESWFLVIGAHAAVQVASTWRTPARISTR